MHHNISVLELFSIGIGPSSSHTVGPMRAASRFARSLEHKTISRIRCSLHGSLADTGKGHATDRAILLGFSGQEPETVDVDAIPAILDDIRKTSTICIPYQSPIRFIEAEDLLFTSGIPLPKHPNGMHFTAIDADGAVMAEEVIYSVGGGFIVSDDEWENDTGKGCLPVPYPFKSAKTLLEHCTHSGKSIPELILANEAMYRTEKETRKRLDEIWIAMQDCVKRGMSADGILPGGLNVPRRAKSHHDALLNREQNSPTDPLEIIDWVNLFALAVNEENAAGGRVVTAPTNGAAGILPAVLEYATRFRTSPYPDAVHRFLLTAGAIGYLYKQNASISGADVGCQGEVGVACSMAAGALTQYLGGTPQQVEFASEIGMEHNLGLTCDPIGGLVQIPCIERNAMGSVKAINASRLAMAGQSTHFVSLDKVIQTMKETGRDMQTKYKETSKGGLAVNIVEC
ncbi:L-serine ammonia-lyase [Kiritimatiellota bacterium B12222]|nr:L-serine ammonia-lyase [Kiritimatiellota bacterium B12222]